MPGGLPEIVQSVGADASKYISQYRAALEVTKELDTAQKGLMRTVAETQNAIKGLGGGSAGAANDIAKVNAAIREQLKVLGDHSAAIAGVSAVSSEFPTRRAPISG